MIFCLFLICLKTKKTRIEKWRLYDQFSARELRSEPFLCIFRFGPGFAYCRADSWDHRFSSIFRTNYGVKLSSSIWFIPQFIAIFGAGPGPKRKMHKKGSDRSSRAENWSHRRHFSMRVFFVFKKIKKYKKIFKKKWKKM